MLKSLAPSRRRLAQLTKRPHSAISQPDSPKTEMPPSPQSEPLTCSDAASAGGVTQAVRPTPNGGMCYFCISCNDEHHLQRSCSVALAPFRRKCGWRFVSVPKDGDCFFHCIASAYQCDEVTIATLRAWVADAATEEQLCFYRVQASAHPDEEWLEFARDPAIGGGVTRENGCVEPVTRPVKTLEEFRAYIRREGREHGEDACLWADSFAFLVIAKRLRLSLLVIDMERDKECSPFRILAEPSAPTHCLVLKRQGGAGHFTLLAQVDDSSRALFDRDTAPNAIRACWPEARVFLKRDGKLG